MYRFLCMTFLVVVCALAPLLPLGVHAQNLLVDGGFELIGRDASTAAWIARGVGARLQEGVGRVAPDDAEGIPFAAVLEPDEDYAAEWVQPLLPLISGSEYVVTAWVKLKGAVGQACLGVRMEQGFPRIYRGLSGEGWERIELVFTAQEGWAQVVLSNTAGATVLWDDIGLYENAGEMERLAATWDQRLRGGNPLYTGLVVDARGSGLQRGMSPKIYDTTGRLVFAGEGASFEQLIRKGLVAYVHSLEEATIHPRLAASPDYPMRLPLVVDAQGSVGVPRTNVLVGDADARRIRRATDQYDFLGRFAIVFVVN